MRTSAKAQTPFVVQLSCDASFSQVSGPASASGPSVIHRAPCNSVRSLTLASDAWVGTSRRLVVKVTNPIASCIERHRSTFKPQGSVNCGEGYLAGSALCGACARSYFPAVDGTCMACPEVDSAWARYSGLLVIVACLAGLVLVVWAALALLVVVRGGTLSGGVARMLNLGALG
jgi:hypothetical protein